MNDNDFKQIAHDILEDYSYAYSEADTGNLAEYLQSKFYEYRAEAIKGFAERLKEEKYLYTDNEISEFAVSVEDIDNLVKEMTEGTP